MNHPASGGGFTAIPKLVLLLLGICAIGSALAQDPRKLARDPDERRPDDQLTIFFLERPLTVGGELGFDSRARTNYTLDGRRERDRYDLRTKLELEALYEASEQILLFFELIGEYEQEFDAHGTPSEHLKRIRRGQGWLYWNQIADTNLSLQIGRQSFRDKREWWWDEQLDAIRLLYDNDAWHAEIAVAEDLGRVSSEQDGINPIRRDVEHILAEIQWTWMRKNQLSAFFTRIRDHSDTHPIGSVLREVDEDPVDLDATWFGFRARGRWKSDAFGRVYYWADVGYVDGRQRETRYDGLDHELSRSESIGEYEVNGWAYDLGLTFDRRKWPGQPKFSIGYAFAAGDNDVTDGKYSGFVQTRLNDNNGKYRGVNRFKYYGEVLRPDLANLEIITAGIGFPFWKNSSMELLWHRYRQDEPSTMLLAGRVKRRPLGESTDIGQAVDFVVGIEEWQHLELELVVGAFRSGEAFGKYANETALNVVFSLDYNF